MPSAVRQGACGTDVIAGPVMQGRSGVNWSESMRRGTDPATPEDTMTTNLPAVTVPSNVAITYAPLTIAPVAGKVAIQINTTEAISLVNRALNAWYYG